MGLADYYFEYPSSSAAGMSKASSPMDGFCEIPIKPIAINVISA
jgi:hypothetical protein